MRVAAQYNVIIHLELYAAAKMQLYTCNHVYWTLILSELHWVLSTCRLSKCKQNFYYYAASDKVYNNKWGIMALCRSNLIGCLQSTVPLRHLIKDYFLCTGSDIMCKQWVLQWVCLGVCVCARVTLEKKRLEAGAFSHVETWMKILCEYSKKPVTACLIIFGCSRPCHCLVLPSGACLSGG